MTGGALALIALLLVILGVLLDQRHQHEVDMTNEALTAAVAAQPPEQREEAGRLSLILDVPPRPGTRRPWIGLAPAVRRRMRRRS